MEEEIWKDIPGYEGYYQASNLGNIKSLIKYNGTNERILKPSKNKDGYLCLILYKNTIKKGFRVHRLIALTFLINLENKKEVNHKNGIKNDNRLENLEWCTASENIIHKYKVLGFKNFLQTNHPMKGKIGELNPKSKKINQYDLEGNFIKTFNGTREIERELGINHSGISLCCKCKLKTSGGYIWKYLSMDELIGMNIGIWKG